MRRSAISVEGSNRPALAPGLSEHEFGRWYWLTDELRAFARELGLPATGSKRVLADRIAAALGGRRHAEPPSVSLVPAAQLTGPLTAATIIPPGQRSSQVLRAWFTDQTGGSFRFDAALRRFIASADGTTTLGEALSVWNASRGREAGTIDDQFEYNRFTRAWHAAHPEGSRVQLIDAWREYRATPIDERERIRGS